ncbi:MAG TPA: HNH endonuclease [Planctomycetaceae bacterium]|jgi:5-methylcytosine-specific restriction endonuclease McrA|nr:HNH endonuclease [Planctomycetaceae bacterium]
MMTAILERPTLILNRNWQPVGVASVARALVKVWNENAVIVDPADYRTYAWEDWASLAPTEGDPVIRTQHLRLRVPEVVVMTNYDKVPTYVVTFSRRNLFKRDGYECQYCARRPGSEELTIDHVIPRAQGGTSSWDNCVLACVACNSKKADRTPDQAGMPLRTKPRRPAWRPMFAARGVRIDSWTKFVSEAWWNVELEE